MPGTSNFKQWNPGAANQQDDATFAADVLRTGGATTAAILPSPVFNKLAYQVSIFTAAFAQMLANKGISTSDANFANLVAALTNVRVSSDFPSAIVTVPYATSVTFDCSTSPQFVLTLTGNVATAALSNATAGQMLAFAVIQDATGGRTMAWPADLSSPGMVCSLPNSISLQRFLVLPSGAVAPVSQMLWITSSGLILNQANAAAVSTSGTIPSTYQELTEKVDATSGLITRTLYSAVGRSGAKVHVNKVDASQNGVKVAAHSGESINGTFADYTIYKRHNSIALVSDGAGWWII